ncbi:terpene cyclase/mutase family protein [Novipirellula rosea]|uniref:Terpene cyclase/mutase family protein n=1 Tax=Novipirellula rosea TaxID=1031540 RepID=A0ABP8MZU2_9BACT
MVRSQSQSLITSLSDYLIGQQSPDGGWKSQTYALLKSGQALTPFVLSILQDCNSSFAESVAAARARSWMINQMRNGVLGVADADVLEYPVFASAFALRCFEAMPDNDAAVDSLRRFLIREQFTESRGFSKSDLAYGGWGFGGTQPPGQTGHMDLSHTRWALAAIRATDDRSSYDDQASTTPNPELDQIYSNAQHFLRLLQKHPSEPRPHPGDMSAVNLDPRAKGYLYDGGFYFSPLVIAANKGRMGQKNGHTYLRSYATATCDGVIALLASGGDASDERVMSARAWLQQHSDWEYPEGIPREHPEPWGDAVYFYHQAVRAEAYWRLGIGGDWAEQLVHRLQRHQRPDASIVNQRSGLMKENDPLLCSALALIAAHYADQQINDATASSSAAR